MPEELVKLLAEEIRQQVELRGWSGRELARRTGLKFTAVSYKLSGERAWGIDDLEAIAPVLGFRDWELLRKARGE